MPETKRFLSTSPLRGTTCAGVGSSCHSCEFLSTSPLRGTTLLPVPRRAAPVHISIHVPLAGDDSGRAGDRPQGGISIHVPLAGDDFPPALWAVLCLIFLSTSPLRGTTVVYLSRKGCLAIFLSTSPLRGTTRPRYKQGAGSRYFYPRPPCGGRRRGHSGPVDAGGISIHVPLAGDDRPGSRRLQDH